MSTSPAAEARRNTFAEKVLPRPMALLAGIAADLVQRRAERAAIAQLQAMSDRELADIGLVRGQERAAVLGKMRT